jgi:carboxylate-amine ligase
VLLATVIRAAVMTAVDARSPDDGPRLPPAALRAAYWKAAHDGLSGHTLDLINGRGAVPARQQLDVLVQRIRPALEALGEYGRVTTELDRITSEGNGAMRQLRAWRQRGQVMDVIDEAARATLS